MTKIKGRVYLVLIFSVFFVVSLLGCNKIVSESVETTWQAEEKAKDTGKTDSRPEVAEQTEHDAQTREEEREERRKKREERRPKFTYDENEKRYYLDTKKYRAEFLPGSFVYIPKIETGMGKRVVFSIKGFYQDGKKLFSDTKTEVPEGRIVNKNILIFKRKDYVEHYVIKRSGFNQGWTIKSPVKTDVDLVLKARVTTEYLLESRGDEGFLIKDGDKTIVNFRQLTAIDVNGKRRALRTELKGEYLEITFPKDYLGMVEFPVAINPPRKMK